MSRLSDLEQAVKTFIAERTGILVSQGTERSLQRFLHGRAADLELVSAQSYLTRLQGSAAEYQKLIEAVTVNHTWFFRDRDQMDVLRGLIAARVSRPVWVWVPGCATGEDAYSVALLGAQLGAELNVVASDINPVVVAAAREGSFPAVSLRDTAPELRERCFRQLGRRYQIDDALRRRVEFQVHNLVDAPLRPPAGGWDVILCRNVLLYFRDDQLKRALRSLASVLAPDGHVFLSACEILQEIPAPLETKFMGGRLALALRKVRAAGGEMPEIPANWRGPPRLVQSLPLPPVELAADAHSVPPPSEERQCVLEYELSLLARGHRLLIDGDAEGARQAYSEAVTYDATCAEARMFLGIACYLLRDLDGAWQALRAAVLLDEDLWWASVYPGLCCESQGYADDAVLAYRQALRACRAPVRRALAQDSPLAVWGAEYESLAASRLRALSGAADSQGRLVKSRR